MSHLYVNNVDRINELSYYDTGSGMSYSWTIENIRQNYTVRAVFNQSQYYSVNLQCDGTGSGIIRKQGYSANYCGQTDQVQEGYYATYSFWPSSGSSLSHLYVNNVDVMNEVGYYDNGSGMSYSWSIGNVRQNYTIRAEFNQTQYYSVGFQCTGTGSGVVRRQGSYTNFCGATDYLQEGYYATYSFIPDYGSSLSHLYVNNVDMINDLYSYEDGSGISYSWTVNNIRQNYSVRAEFNQTQYYSVGFQCTGTGSGVVRRQGSYTNFCGATDYLQEGYYATYSFIPDYGSSLSHLYVNNVDMINDLYSYEDGSGISYSWTVNNIRQNYSVRAEFNQTQYYSVGFQCTGTGSGVVRRQGSYTNFCGATDYLQEGYYATYSFIPDYGSSLSHLYVNNVDMINNLYSYEEGSGISYSWSVNNIRQDYTVRAEFNQPQYSILVFSANEIMGSVTGGGVFYGGSQTTISATPNAGYRFVGWNDNNTDNPRTITVTGDATYIATFEALPSQYSILVFSANEIMGSATGGGVFYGGSQTTISATPNAGYRFVGWNDNNTDNPRTITVTGDATYIASFDVNTYYSSFTAEACGSYTWNDQTYTTSGEYQQTFTASNSADSIVTLTLTILPTPQPTITIYGELDACNPSSVALVTEQYQSYLWSNGATTIATSVIEPGYYYVEVVDENGCTGVSEQINIGVSNAILEAPQIAVVGLNNMNKNVVAWSAVENANAYRIYRENNIANVYELMATVGASAQTYWTDETADPSARAYRYKITAVDECGGESPMSDYHKTMHLTINQGIGNAWNLIWSNYEGFDFGTYRIYRGTAPSNMTMIGEVPSNLNSYTDNTAPASTGFYYQVEVIRNARSRDAEISSRSNIVDNGYAPDNAPEFTITVISANTNRGTVVGGGTYAAGTVITIAAIANSGYIFAGWNDGNIENPRQVIVTADATYIASFEHAVGIEESVVIETVIFPNPTTDVLNITSSETISEIEIVNVMGQVVKRMEVNADNVVCNVEDLTSGVYVVRICTLRYFGGAQQPQAQGAVISQHKFVKE